MSFNTVELFVSPANFKRPIVIMGPLNDIAMEKLAREMPNEYEVAGWFLLFFTLLFILDVQEKKMCSNLCHTTFFPTFC